MHIHVVLVGVSVHYASVLDLFNQRDGIVTCERKPDGMHEPTDTNTTAQMTTSNVQPEVEFCVFDVSSLV